MRGPAAGKSSDESKGMAPNWVHAQSSHPGVGVEGVRNDIHFARIFYKDGSGRRDYVWLEAIDLNNRNDFDFKPHVWRNDGEGGTQRMSDFDRYCDMVCPTAIRSERTCRRTKYSYRREMGKQNLKQTPLNVLIVC